MFDKKEYNKQWCINNRERLFEKRKEYHKQWCKANPEKVKGYKRKWEEENKEYRIKYKQYYYERYKDYFAQHYQKNKEEIKKYGKQHYADNCEKITEQTKQYRKDNIKKIRKYKNDKYKNDIKYNINHKIGRAISKSLKGNKSGRHWEILVGYSLEDLIKRLKSTLLKDYTWQDYLEGKLHVDHKIPISTHNFTKPEHIDFKNCWALSNLQLLPARDNIVKSNKLTRPFQPALKLELIKS